jgi:hypothetical protein
MGISMSPDRVKELSNAAKISLAMQFLYLEINPDLLLTTPRDQLVVDCMMEDYSNINFEDPALVGLFNILGVDHSEIPGLKVSDFIELFRDGDGIIEHGWLVGEIFANPGAQMILEASLVKGGLDTLNQLLKYACLNPLSNEIELYGLNRIDPEELNRVSGNLYSIRIKIHDNDVDSDDDCCLMDMEYYSKELYYTTDLKSLLSNGQIQLDAAINELLERSSAQPGLKHHITDIEIYSNGETALHMKCSHNITDSSGSWLNMINMLAEFDVMTNDKLFCEDYQKVLSSSDVSRRIRGRILENALGL